MTIARIEDVSAGFLQVAADIGGLQRASVVTPQMFGPTGGGDDTGPVKAAIQRAGDARRMSLGSAVYDILPPGGTPTDGVLNPTQPIKIAGDGAVLRPLTPHTNILMRFGLYPGDREPDIIGGGIDGVVFDGGFDASNPANHAGWSDTGTMTLWAAGVKDWTLRDVKSANSSDYGIGLQTGRHQRIRIRDVVVENTMNDAIDQKNNWSRGRDNSMIGFWAERFGQGGLTGGLYYAGIDLQAPRWIASHVWATDWGQQGETAAGIRFKQGEVGDAQGLGAYKAILTGFHVEAKQGGIPDTIGVDARHRKNIIALGTIEGTRQSGVSFIQEDGFAIGLDIKGADKTAGAGIRSGVSAYASQGDYLISAASRVSNYAAGLNLRRNGGIHVGHHLRGNGAAVATQGNDNVVLAWSEDNGAVPVVDLGLRNWIGLWEAGTLNVYRAGVKRYSFGDIIESRSPASAAAHRLSATDNAAWLETKVPVASTGFWQFDTNGAFEWLRSGTALLRLSDGGMNVRVPLNLLPYTVNGVLALTKTAGSVVYCTNGDAGQPCLAVCDGTNWRRVSLGAAVSTT